MNNIRKYINISAAVLLIASVALIIFNYFYVPNYVIGELKGEYLLTYIVANNDISFDELANIAAKLVTYRNLIVFVIAGFFQLLFIILFNILYKRNKGIILLTLSNISHLLTYSIVFIIIYYNKYVVDLLEFYSWQNAIIFVILIIQTALLFQFVYEYIRIRWEETKPITALNFNNFGYSFIRFFIIILLILGVTVLTTTFIVYQVSLTLISYLSIETLTGLPSVVSYNILELVTDIPPMVENLLKTFQYESLMFDIKSGNILINIENLSTLIQTKLSNYATMYFNDFKKPFVIVTVFFAVIQALNYMYRKYIYNNVVFLVLVTVAIISLQVYITNNNLPIFTTLNALLVVASIYYILLYLDYRLADYRFTRIVCDWLNSITLPKIIKDKDVKVAVNENIIDVDTTNEIE